MNFSMVKQAMELKSKLGKAQKELSKMTVEAESGKGAVQVVINGQQKLMSLKISPEAAAGKTDQLEKLVMKAMNDGLEKSNKLSQKYMSSLAGDLKVPGLTD